ncbi:hypothetical protein [Streptomyces chartreusis]
MWFEELPPVAYVEGLKSGRIWELQGTVRELEDVYDSCAGRRDVAPKVSGIAQVGRGGLRA